MYRVLPVQGCTRHGRAPKAGGLSAVGAEDAGVSGGVEISVAKCMYCGAFCSSQLHIVELYSTAYASYLTLCSSVHVPPYRG